MIGVIDIGHDGARQMLSKVCVATAWGNLGSV